MTTATRSLLPTIRECLSRQPVLLSSWASMTIRSSLLGFFFCTYAVSWLCWLPVVADSSGYIALPISKHFLTTLGQFGPFVAAILMTALQTGKAGLRELGRSLLRWKVHPIWFGVALCLPPASFLGAITAHAVVRGVPPEFKEVSLLYNVFFNFFLLLFWGGPLGEELGWRGFALPRLQRIQSRVVASIILGAAWGGWHLPIFVMAGAFTIPVFALYVVSTIPLTILMTWLFNHSKGSLLLAMLFHGSLNTFYIILPIEPAFLAWVILLWILALLVITTEKGWFTLKQIAEPLVVCELPLLNGD
jgi:membrane protease YdiL (CAAX protease family)